jgi:hypothetical protein
MGDERMASIQSGSYGMYGQPDIELTPIWSPRTLAGSPGNSSSPLIPTYNGAATSGPLAFNFRTAGGDGTYSNQAYSDVRDLRYGDPNLDYNLEHNADSVLRLNSVPAEVTAMYWANAEGKFFFYFKDKDGHESEAPHYLPASARQISINGGNLIDLDQKRNRVSSMLMHDAISREIEVGGSQPNEALILAFLKKDMAVRGENPNAMPEHLSKLGFGSLARIDQSGDVLARLSWVLTLSVDQLRVQETLLQDSNNPTSRVWLADIRFGLAIKPILEGSGSLSPDNPQTLAYVRDALELIASAQNDCMTSFLRWGKTPDKDMDCPFEPFDVTPYGSYGWNFYAGTYDQGRLRGTALRWLHNAILKQMSWNDILKKLGLADLPSLTGS